MKYTKQLLSVILAAAILLCAIPAFSAGAPADLAPTGDTPINVSVTVNLDYSVTVTWNKVAGAEDYWVSLFNAYPNGSWPDKVLDYNVVSADKPQSCTFDAYYFEQYANGGMDYKITVTARDYPTVLGTGEKIFRTEMPILNDPANVRLDHEGMVTWRGDARTNRYCVMVYDRNGEYLFLANGYMNPTKNDLSRFLTVGESYSVSVNANGENYRESNTVFSQTVQFYGELNEVSGVKWDGYRLSWDAVPHAAEYELQVYKATSPPEGSVYWTYDQKGMRLHTSSTSFNFASQFEGYGAGQYVVTVTARDGDKLNVSKTTDSPIVDYTPPVSKHSINVNLTSFLSDTDTIRVYLQKASGGFPAFKPGSGNSWSFSFTDLEDGRYTVTIMKKNHTTRKLSVYFSGNDADLSIKLHPVGDISGDGKVTTVDFGKANSHARGKSTLMGYEFDCAEVTGDDKVSTADAGKINSHARGKSNLWQES